MTAYVFIQPLDVLLLRGNRLFGAPGSYGESLIPPWPSAAAGAIRAHLLTRDGSDLPAFAAGQKPHPELGTPAQPGPFAVTDFQLARQVGGQQESLHPLPADLVVTRRDTGDLVIQALKPHQPVTGIASSSVLASLPVLAESMRAKPVTGLWLTEAGWRAYLAGQLPTPGQCLDTSHLWRLEARVGVGLDPARGRAEDGKLFTAQAVAFAPDVGFLTGITGTSALAAATIRLGGDGRGAHMTPSAYRPPQTDLRAIANQRRARLVLTAPGLFADGWRLPGVDASGHFQLGAVRGRLTCAAVPRYEVVSGWDLARGRPKTAQRAAPAGSVYWLEDLEAEASDLDKLVATGLWRAAEENPPRQVEGFNRFTFAMY